jgi:hypothetical protein
MADLSPDLTGKLGRLLPRLASDSPGEVNATVQAIRRTLDRAGLDLHDLAARLTEAPRPVHRAPATPDWHHPRQGADLLAMALWLQARALDRLTLQQRDFVATAARLLAAGRELTPKQAQWLRSLHAQHKGAATC